MAQPVEAFDRSFGVLEHALRVAMVRHNAIQSNIANAETPGFKRVEVNFESLLKRRIGDGPIDPGVFRSVQPEMVEDKSDGKADGNNVELDREIGDLDKNKMQYEVLAEFAALRFSGLRSAITSK